jgi:hypothetical protein
VVYDKDGWLFGNDHQWHDLKGEDLRFLMREAVNDRLWIDNARREYQELERHQSEEGKFSQGDFLRMVAFEPNLSGMLYPYPFGSAVTFDASKHLFRGENSLFPESLPSLRRKTAAMDQEEADLYRFVNAMRISNFTRFLQSKKIVQEWTCCDVNYLALAQHYGLETDLLDLTNDFFIALFFATTIYEPAAKTYRPIGEEDLKNGHEFGVIFCAPDWTVDFFQPMPSVDWSFRHPEIVDDSQKVALDSGELDSIAFQIGQQPLMRCSAQSGYVFPLRRGKPLQENGYFEKLRFRQSPALSRYVFDLCERGRLVFPQEGLTDEDETQVDRVKSGMTFLSIDFETAWANNPIGEDPLQVKEMLKKRRILIRNENDGESI